MKLALQFGNDAYAISSEDLPAWLALLDKAIPARRVGYGSEQQFLLQPLDFTLDVIAKDPEPGTNPAS